MNIVKINLYLPFKSQGMAKKIFLNALQNSIYPLVLHSKPYVKVIEQNCHVLQTLIVISRMILDPSINPDWRYMYLLHGLIQLYYPWYSSGAIPVWSIDNSCLHDTCWASCNQLNIFDVWLLKGFICFFIQYHLEPFCFPSLDWSLQQFYS